MKRIRGGLSYANVTATLALLIAVAGGSAAVALSAGKDSVRSATIKDAQVTARDLAGARVAQKSAQLLAGQVASLQVSCRKGEQVLGGGGGVSPSGGGNERLIRSTPLPNGWTVTATKDGSVPTQFDVSAVCLRAKPGD